MAALRWILLTAGVVLILAIWWSGRRRRETESGLPDAGVRERRREPGLDGAAAADDAVEMPVLAAAPADRLGLPRSPPVVEIPPDVEPELDVAGPSRVPTAALPPMRAGEPLRGGDVVSGIRPVADRGALPGDRERWIRTQPMRRSEVSAAGGGPRRAAVQDDADPVPDQTAAHAESPQARQRIVALRVMSGDERWPGADLIAALQFEGLVFGKYSIYHRQRDDGRSIYCIASMVEPGSFDLDTIETQSYPGVSVFAVLPGPIDAPTTFDQMLATARRLAERLGGNLQDEHGSSLTAQRILNLREELVHFEHLQSRRPRRP
jgi:cell division protein ZipA